VHYPNPIAQTADYIFLNYRMIAIEGISAARKIYIILIRTAD